MVFETAEFMASFAEWDSSAGRFVLGPVLQCAQEIFPKDRTFNPTYELTYWRWGLETAQRWRERLGLPRLPAWDRVLARLDTPKNHYRKNGHNHQRPGLTVYLPGNGGLLAATAMMACGWDGAPEKHAPGFPDDGRWSVMWENLRPMP